MPEGEHVRGSFADSVVEQRADQKNNAGTDRNPMQLRERAANDVASQVSVGQDLKCSRRKHKGEEDQAADPDHEREQHEIAEEGHTRLLSCLPGGKSNRRGDAPAAELPAFRPGAGSAQERKYWPDARRAAA